MGPSGLDLVLHLWDIETGHEITRPFYGHPDGIWFVVVLTNGQRAASAWTDGTTRVWGIETSREIRCLDRHGAHVMNFEFLPDGKRLLSARMDRHLRLWDLATGREIRRVDGLRGGVAAVEDSPDGHRALNGGIDDRYLRLRDLNTGRELYHYDVPHVAPTRGAFTRDGRQAIWVSFDGALRVWDLPQDFTAGPGTGESR